MRAGPGRAALARRRRRGRPSSSRCRRRRSPPPPPPASPPPPPRFLLLLLLLLAASSFPSAPDTAFSARASTAAPGLSARTPRELAPRPGAPGTKAGGTWGRTEGRALEAGTGEPGRGAVRREERRGRSGPRDPWMGLHPGGGVGLARRRR